MALILVDTSYTSFYRFFATLRWFTFAHKDLWALHKDDAKYDWTENKEFLEKYSKMYFDSIIKLVKKKNMKDAKVIFCHDASQSTLWRHKLVDEYKGERYDHSEKRNFKGIFKYTYETLIPKLHKHEEHEIKSLKFESTEADDIIAVISKYYEEHYPEKKVIIISGDDDFTQLCRTNLEIYDYRHKKPIIITKEESQKALIRKIIDGDVSDNIKSILNIEGKKLRLQKNKKEEMINDETELERFLNEHPEIKKNYERNSKLINFDLIPSKIKNPIIKKVKNL